MTTDQIFSTAFEYMPYLIGVFCALYGVWCAWYANEKVFTRDLVIARELDWKWRAKQAAKPLFIGFWFAAAQIAGAMWLQQGSFGIGFLGVAWCWWWAMEQEEVTRISGAIFVEMKTSGQFNAMWEEAISGRTHAN
jgi:hypothetical protein